MGVVVLKPEDCLKLPNPMKRPKNPWNNRRKRTQSNRRKRSPNTSPPSPPTVVPKAPALVMGQVKILKHGEELKEFKPIKPVKVQKENVDVDLGSTNCLGPDPVSVPSPIGLTESKNNSNNSVPAPFYAGSAFVTSPPPSSVPLPAFFTKKIGVALKDDVASDLRRILRLDL